MNRDAGFSNMKLKDVYRLFEGLNSTDGNRTGDSLNPFLNIFDAFARITGQSIHVTDYYQRRFVYVSSDPLFLCGYKVEEILQMGYSFYEKAVVKEDLALLEEIDKKGHELFCRLPLESRLRSMLSFDYRMLQPDGKSIMVNQRNTPAFLTEQGEVRFALCVVSLSTHKHPGNVIIKVDDILHNYEYSFESKKWRKVSRILLTEREKDVLRLSARGCSNDVIADTLFINLSTVKFHKTNIYDKLNVKNITEAVTFANNYNLL